jgi:predicted kinase
MEAVILVGIQGSGKTTFYRERFAETYVHISLDVLKTRAREVELMQSCLAAGKPFVVDNTNVRIAERAVYIAAAKRAGFRVIGYYFQTTLGDALRRNKERTGKAVIPAAGVAGTLKRLEPPTLSEGFDELHLLPERRRIFLLSPANCGGIRGGLLLRQGASFDLAMRLTGEGAPLGEVFEFISGLYFRGKLAYASKFADPPEDIPGTWIITSGQGLIPPDTVVTMAHLQQLAGIPIDAADRRYREPLERACRTLDELAGSNTDYVLLGSVATTKYIEPIHGVFGERLLFPQEFLGRGDMSRGGLLLRCVGAGQQLTYVPLGNLTRHGARPPKLPRLR